MVRFKTCTKCGIEKQICDFYRSKKSPDGYEWRCKKCKISSAVTSQQNRKEKLNEKRRNKYKESKDYREICAKRLAEWRRNNKEKVSSQRKRSQISLKRRKECIDTETLDMIKNRNSRKRLSVKNLDDSYIRRFIRASGFYSVTSDLIEIKRYQLQVYRAVKQLKQAINERVEQCNK